MDKIYLEGMDFYGYHGVLPAEQQIGQRFLVDLTLKTDLRPAGRSDDLNQTVNYAEVYNLVRAVVEQERYALIEALAERIADIVLEKFQVQQVKVRVHKPQAPIPGVIRNVAVEIMRKHAE